ncbi:hypothetical protein B0I72DRAFT_103480 [Yarrowia lipolytica]|nr:hypothetical protein B0I72DRAFT_103480 [Yarrowia lipolytica]RDW37536.1 hypothetical protein B0I73DRAFT_102471 [Yarrowia lipolytica]RDW43520.1 hypothetical protein B0I74DRAFT_103336 [Yarrowia lipolytica]RDW50630.1 hypothetical protein B0I75DRAFT_165938 [Yarrowia lipolytica]
MLPPELVDILCEHLDIGSLVALSQTSTSWRGAINDTVFKTRLTRICPWFEPHLSRRFSWKECAAVYETRLNGGRIASALELTSCNKFSEPLKIRSGAEQLDIRKLLENPVYTSEHGIQVDLADYVKHLRKRPDYERDDNFTRIISLPDMLIVVWLSSTMCSWVNLCDIRVKMRGDGDGDGDKNVSLKADCSQQLEVHTMPWFQVLGTHVFLVTIEYWNSDRDPRWTLWYVDGGIRKLFQCPGERPQSVVCYDGLFRYFEDNTYHVFQVGLDGTEVRDSTDFFLTALHFLNEPDEVYPRNNYSVIIDENDRPYIVDYDGGTVHSAREDGDVIRVTCDCPE